MSKVLALFARTFDQVTAVAEAAPSPQAGNWGARARALGAGIALTLAASASAQQVIMTQQQRDAQDREKVASRVGGVVGGVAGLALTRDSSTVVRVLGTVLGVTAGSTLGSSMVGGDSGRTVSDPQRAIVSQDALFGVLNGSPGDRVATSLRGRYGEAVVVTRAALDDAVAAGASPQPAIPAQGLKPLELETHRGLYQMMVDTVAYRATAVAALHESERLQIAAAVDGTKRQQAENAARLSREAFQGYNGAFRKVWDVLAMADQAGYDVWSQRLAMSAVPPDLRTPLQANLRWPGAEERAVQVAESLVAVRSAQASEMDGRAQLKAQELRVAVARPVAR